MLTGELGSLLVVRDVSGGAHNSVRLLVVGHAALLLWPTGSH